MVFLSHLSSSICTQELFMIIQDIILIWLVRVSLTLCWAPLPVEGNEWPFKMMVWNGPVETAKRQTNNGVNKRTLSHTSLKKNLIENGVCRRRATMKQKSEQAKDGIRPWACVALPRSRVHWEQSASKVRPQDPQRRHGRERSAPQHSPGGWTLKTCSHSDTGREVRVCCPLCYILLCKERGLRALRGVMPLRKEGICDLYNLTVESLSRKKEKPKQKIDK